MSKDRQIKGYIKDSSIYLIGNFIIGISGLLSIKIYTKLFSSGDYGDLSIAYNTLILISLIFCGWIQQGTVRFFDSYNKDKKTIKNFYTTIFCILTIINVSLFIIIISASFIIKNNILVHQYKIYFFSSFMIMSQGYFDVINSLLRVLRKPVLFTLNNIIVSILKLLGVVLLVKVFESGVESIIISIFIGNIICVVLALNKLKIFKFIDFKYYSHDIIKAFMSYGFPLLGIAFTSWVLAASDKYFIRFFCGSSQVAIYSINYSLGSSMFSILINFMMMGAFPIIIRTWNQFGKKQTEDLVNKMIRYYLIITIPAFFGAMGLSKNILMIFSTNEYAKGHWVFSIVCLGNLLLGLTQYSNKVWELTKNTKKILKFNFLVAICNSILNLFLIPIFGYKVAAITTVISYSIYFVISLYQSKNIFKIEVEIKSVINILISSSIMLGIIELINLKFGINIISLILGFITGTICYFICMYFSGELKQEISALFKKILSKSYIILNNNKQKYNK
ncbi:lipopolysaccharide biosynthesis protein [Hathewaya histolytica]|uniref:lipopolysaccharide biosynthesis protein n=1 Tax=Hathewaya histolytica TaxID=1498 RepID=UPI003B67C799